MSGFRVAGTLSVSHPLEEETPLFAADATFAWAHGGPVTRAFLEGLPWTQVVIDSSLAWLTPGIGHTLESPERAVRGPQRFQHELYPGVVEGVRGQANRNRQIQHRWCVLGVEATPEVVEGSMEAGDAFWFTGDFAARDAEIERQVQAGALRLRSVEVGALIDFGWGTLMRARPAMVAGFQLILRATAFDGRPIVNGRRNLAML